jgi:uncharacterized membrane protein YjjP (DUF1212 family)
MNPKDIWQGQKRENPTMSVEEIQEKVGKLRRKARREMIFNLVVATVSTLFFIGVFFDIHNAYERFSWGLVVAGGLYMLVHVVHESVEMMRAERVCDDAGVSSCLRFYRGTLERKRKQVRRSPVVAALLVTGTIMTVLPGWALILQHPDGNIWIKQAPFWIILGLWGFSIYLMRRRIRNEFQREFAILERLEKEFGE